MNEHTTTDTDSTDRDRDVLYVTIGDSLQLLDDEADDIAAALRGEDIDGSPHRLNFHSNEQFQEVFNARTLELLQAIATHRPESIRELSRLVERDVSPVHRDLERLAAYGLVAYEHGVGRAKRPTIPYDEIDISVSFDRDPGPDRAAAPG